MFTKRGLTRRLFAVAIAMVMAATLIGVPMISNAADVNHKRLEEKYSIYQETGKYIADNNSSITYVDEQGQKVGKEGYLIGLARSGYPVGKSLYSNYYESVKKYLSDNGNKFESVTECAKVVTTLNAIGYDPSDIEGVDITVQLDDASSVNGAWDYAYALIAMDSKNYDMSNRDTYVANLLDKQLDSGAWSWNDKDEDIDTTGMVLAALAPYYGRYMSVTTAVDKALDYLSAAQNQDGTFSSWGNANSNTTAMVLLGLTAQKVDVDEDTRFVKNNISVADALCSFAVQGGGFGWIDNEEVNEYATYQSYYSLCSYFRYTSAHNRLFDMTAESVSDNVAAVDYVEGVVIIIDPVKGEYVSAPIAVVKEGMVYRMYDPNRGEHFYTKNVAEAELLETLGWQHESNADFDVVSAGDVNAIAVYRLYNPNGEGMHFYTENVAEAMMLCALGWNYEGISHYVYDKDSLIVAVAQYRLYNPNSPIGEHNWTSSEAERNMLINDGWKDEGVCWKIK